MLFWGLNLDIINSNSTTGWGCPISIYKSSGTTNKLQVYNKITVYFALKDNSFPKGDKAYYKL